MFPRLTPVVKNLLLINILIFFADFAFFNMGLSHWLGLRYVLAETFIPIQFVTYMFLHGSMIHLFSNMFALFIFGPLLEQFWGPKRFLIFYMVCGIGSGVLYSATNFVELRKMQNETNDYLTAPAPEKFSDYIAEHGTIGQMNGRYLNLYSMAASIEDGLYKHPNDYELVAESKKVVLAVYDFISNKPMVGASGAIFGILMAFGMLFPNTVLMLLFPPIPIKAKYFVTFYGLFELYAGLQRDPGDNVAHFAHIGGMLVAFILLRIWRKDTRRFY